VCLHYVDYTNACFHFHSTARLDLSGNSLTGTIPTEIALLSNLCESSVVWILVLMIVWSCVFFIVLSCLLSFFIIQLGCLYGAIV
jgi:hypothetical protein